LNRPIGSRGDSGGILWVRRKNEIVNSAHEGRIGWDRRKRRTEGQETEEGGSEVECEEGRLSATAELAS
jgi:hypothetical protein